MTPDASTAARPGGLRALVYARQSLDRTGEGAAVERQVDACSDLARRRGWTVVGVEVDNDMSASTGKARPGYSRVLDAVRAGRVERVVVWHVDRLTRRMVELEDVIAACEASGAGVATVTGDLDLTTDTGRMLARILASVARGEVERKGARQRAANAQRAAAGHMGWTRRPFGYERVDGVVRVVEAEAAALQAAAASVLAGGTLAAAVRDLQAAGLPTSTGGAWSVTTLRRALLSPRYAGRASYNGADVAEGAWPVVLDAATQERLSQVLRDPRRRVQQGTALRYWLSGWATCGRCGERMFATPMGEGSQRRMVYRCRTGHLARRVDLVDEVVDGVVLARLAMPDAASTLLPDVDLDALRAEADDLRDRRDAVAAMVGDGLVSPTAGRAQASTLTERLREVEARVLQAEDGSPLAPLLGAEDVRAVWEAMPLRRRREVVEVLLDRVTITPAGKGVRFDPAQVVIAWRAEDAPAAT